MKLTGSVAVKKVCRRQHPDRVSCRQAEGGWVRWLSQPPTKGRH